MQIYYIILTFASLIIVWCTKEGVGCTSLFGLVASLVKKLMTKFYQEFQELSWMDVSKPPLIVKRLKMYVMSMREVVKTYKNSFLLKTCKKRS